MADESEPRRYVSDQEFWTQLWTLRETRKFLLREGVSPGPSGPDGDTPFSLGRLNLIKYRTRIPYGKRSLATVDDWQLLEHKQESLQRFFTSELQQRFRLYESQRTINFISLCLAVFALIFLLGGVFPPGPLTQFHFICYIFWASCLGGLGAVSFLAVNSLAIQNDLTFDISNQRLVAMRVVLGALFGLLVSLPFGYQYFKDFRSWVIGGGDLGSVQGIFLLLPFLLGFSTTLVMTVLNRMVNGVETVFGISIDRERAQANGPRPAKPPRLQREADVSDHHAHGQSSEVVTRLSAERSGLSAERSGRPGPV